MTHIFLANTEYNLEETISKTIPIFLSEAYAMTLFWILSKRWWGGSGISWTISKSFCTSLQTNNHTSTSSLNFYRPDALSDDQPTVSQQWRQASTNREIMN